MKNHVLVKCHAILDIENAGISFNINVKKNLIPFTWLSLYPSTFKWILSGVCVSIFSQTIFITEGHNSIKSHPQADMNESMYLSMLL